MGRKRNRQNKTEDDGLIEMMLEVAIRSPLGGGLTVVFLIIVGLVVAAAMPERLRPVAHIASLILFGLAGIVGLVTVAGMMKRILFPRREEVDTAPRPQAGSSRGDSLLTPGELAFYHPLREIVGNRFTIQIKPSLADVLQRRSDPRWKTIASMHVDFLLCDAKTLRPCLAIELDDRSHRTGRRADADRYKEELLAEQGIPLLRQRCEQAYDVEKLRMNIERALR